MYTIKDYLNFQIEEEKRKAQIAAGVRSQPTIKIKKRLPSAFVVTTLGLHPGFHRDEGAGVWMARKFEKAEKMFPGIKSAALQFWTIGQSLSAPPNPNAIFLGCGGDEKTDEHALGADKYQETCSALLFAELLKLTDDKALMTVVTKIRNEDRAGASNARSVHSVLTKIHRMDHKLPIEQIVEWVEISCEAEYKTLVADGVEESKLLTIERGKEHVARWYGAEKAEQWYDLGDRAVKNFEARSGRIRSKLLDDKIIEKPQWWSPMSYLRYYLDDKKKMKTRVEHLKMVVMRTDNMEANNEALKLDAAVVIIQKLNGQTHTSPSHHVKFSGSLKLFQAVSKEHKKAFHNRLLSSNKPARE